MKDALKASISKNGNEHILIHSDILFGFKMTFENQDDYVTNHYSELENVCKPLKMIMPAFNYDFCKGEPYDILKTESQVGVLSEYFRKSKSEWRITTPVFNFSGTGAHPVPERYGRIDPFDEHSLFSFLHKNKGLLMHYGSGFQTTTLIHYAERISNCLIYRYDKKFDGLVIDANGNEHTCELVYHVRPMGYQLDYDWEKIENDLLSNNLIEKWKEKRTHIMIGRIDKIVDFWLDRLHQDAFYLLHPDTKAWVADKFKELNRRFELTDFE